MGGSSGQEGIYLGGSLPTLNKSFSPTMIGVGQATVLTFILSVPAGNPAGSNVSFVDTLAASLHVATNLVGGTCANAAAATSVTVGGHVIKVSGLQVPAGGPSGASCCTVTVNVTAADGNASCNGNPAGFTNSSANVTVTFANNSVQPSCLVVTSQPISVSPAGCSRCSL